MLKRLILNQKIVPVPVPLRNLAEVCAWVDETLVSVGETVTFALLDGKDILELWGSKKVCESISIHHDTRLELRIESPEQLALQSLEAIHSLAGAISSGLKALAVHLWQARRNDIQPELSAVVSDVDLVCELLNRLWDMGVSDRVNLDALAELLARVNQIREALNVTMSQGDWKGVAQVLLRDTPATTGLESALRGIAKESEMAHMSLLSFGSRPGRIDAK